MRMTLSPFFLSFGAATAYVSHAPRATSIASRATVWVRRTLLPSRVDKGSHATNQRSFSSGQWIQPSFVFSSQSTLLTTRLKVVP